MSRNHYFRSGDETEVTDLKIDRRTGEFRERFLFQPFSLEKKSNVKVPMVVRELQIQPKGRDKEWYRKRAEANARALGMSSVHFNWGIQAPKTPGQPYSKVVVDKKARAEARRASRSEPQQYTKGGSQAAHMRYKVQKAKDETRDS